MERLKNTVLLICIGLITFGANAQIRVIEETNNFGGEMLKSLVVTMPLVTEKDAVKKFKSLLKDYKGDVKKSKGQYTSTETLISDISNDPITVYFEVDESGEGSILRAAWNLSGRFVSKESNPTKYILINKMMRDFAVKISRESVAERLEDATKEQEKLEKAQSRLEKEKERLQKSIVNNKERIIKAQNDIKEAENNIITNADEQIKKKDEIAKNKAKVEKIKRELDNVK